MDRLTSQVPDFVSKSKIMLDIYSSQAVELDKINEYSQDAFNQTFVETATWGLDVWEKFLGITTNKTLSYENRRAAIYAKLQASSVLTKERLLNVLAGYGVTDVRIIENDYPYRVTIINNSDDEDDDGAVRVTGALKDLIPAHLAFYYVFKTIGANKHYLNGTEQYIDFYSPATLKNTIVLSKVLPETSSQIRLMTPYKKRKASKGYDIHIERVEFSTKNEYRETLSKYSPHTTYFDMTSASHTSEYGSHYVGENPFTSYVKYKFKGTEADVYAHASNYGGIVSIELDGELVGEVDTYTSEALTYEKRIKLMTLTDLKDIEHTIKVTLTDKRNENIPSNYRTRLCTASLEYRPSTVILSSDYLVPEYSNTGFTIVEDERAIDGFVLYTNEDMAEILLSSSKMASITIWGTTTPNSGKLNFSIGTAKSNMYGVTPYQCNTSSHFLRSADYGGTVYKREMFSGDAVWQLDVADYYTSFSSSDSVRISSPRIRKDDKFAILSTLNTDARQDVFAFNKDGEFENSVTLNYKGTRQAITSMHYAENGYIYVTTCTSYLSNDTSAAETYLNIIDFSKDYKIIKHGDFKGKDFRVHAQVDDYMLVTYVENKTMYLRLYDNLIGSVIKSVTLDSNVFTSTVGYPLKVLYDEEAKRIYVCDRYAITVYDTNLKLIIARKELPIATNYCMLYKTNGLSAFSTTQENETKNSSLILLDENLDITLNTVTSRSKTGCNAMYDKFSNQFIKDGKRILVGFEYYGIYD